MWRCWYQSATHEDHFGRSTLRRHHAAITSIDRGENFEPGEHADKREAHLTNAIRELFRRQTNPTADFTIRVSREACVSKEKLRLVDNAVAE
jgi:hypothetical protein